MSVAEGESLAFSTLNSRSEIAKFILEIARLGLLEFESSKALSKLWGIRNKTSKLSSNSLGALILFILSNSANAEVNSVSALIKSAWAPAKDDSDWAKSVKLISPFWSLDLSDSTWRSNKSTLAKLKSLLLPLNFRF